MNGRKAQLGLLAALFAATAPIAGAERPSREPDHVVPGWFLGMPVLVRSWETLSLDDRIAGRFPEDEPSVPAYIVAPLTQTSAVSPERVIELPERTVTLPAHQATLSAMRTPEDPVMTVAWFVIPGPNASEETVRSDPMPADSWAGAPLAREIRVGTEWVSLNNHAAISYGLELGLLDLRYFDGGSKMWATLDWESFEFDPALLVRCSAAPEEHQRP